MDEIVPLSNKTADLNYTWNLLPSGTLHLTESDRRRSTDNNWVRRTCRVTIKEDSRTRNEYQNRRGRGCDKTISTGPEGRAAEDGICSQMKTEKKEY